MSSEYDGYNNFRYDNSHESSRTEGGHKIDNRNFWARLEKLNPSNKSNSNKPYIDKEKLLQEKETENYDKYLREKKIREFINKGYSYDEATHLARIWSDAIWVKKEEDKAKGFYRDNIEYYNTIGNEAVFNYLQSKRKSKGR